MPRYEVLPWLPRVPIRRQPSVESECLDIKVPGEVIEVIGALAFDDQHQWVQVNVDAPGTRTGWMAVHLREHGVHGFLSQPPTPPRRSVVESTASPSETAV